MDEPFSLDGGQAEAPPRQRAEPERINPFVSNELPGLRHIISLGAGVQSSTLALMAAHGLVRPMPEVAIFADTGWEPRAVYEWLDWLEQQLPYPVARVQWGNIRDEQITARLRGKRGEDGSRWASLPYYTAPGPDGREGRVQRQCTKEYKIWPIERYMKRDMLGLVERERAPREPVIAQWRGISMDEIQRANPSRERWFIARYPLLEARMTRGHCLEWMAQHGYPEPPRSACLGCPFHSDAEWLRIKNGDPAEWRDVVEFDHAIRHAGGMERPTYLHRSCQPIDEVEFTTAESAGQFGLECEGMCGL